MPAFILELLNEAAFMRFIGDKGVRTLADAREYMLKGPIDSYERHGFGLYAACLRDGTPIGICGLVKRDGLADAGRRVRVPGATLSAGIRHRVRGGGIGARKAKLAAAARRCHYGAGQPRVDRRARENRAQVRADDPARRRQRRTQSVRHRASREPTMNLASVLGTLYVLSELALMLKKRAKSARLSGRG